MSVFVPNLILHDVTQITTALLKEQNIRALILDVDNTLTTHGSQQIDAKTLEWISQMQASGIKMVIASNNNYRRVQTFAQKIGLDFVCSSCKPLRRGFTKALCKMETAAQETAVVGDQIYTDILGGNRSKMFTILVECMKPEGSFFFKLKRRMEKAHIQRYYHQLSAGQN